MTGAEFKALREQWGLTQAQMAARLARDVMTISRWERGITTIPETVARTLKEWGKEK